MMIICIMYVCNSVQFDGTCFYPQHNRFMHQIYFHDQRWKTGFWEVCLKSWTAAHHLSSTLLGCLFVKRVAEKMFFWDTWYTSTGPIDLLQMAYSQPPLALLNFKCSFCISAHD